MREMFGFHLVLPGRVTCQRRVTLYGNEVADDKLENEIKTARVKLRGFFSIFFVHVVPE